MKTFPLTVWCTISLVSMLMDVKTTQLDQQDVTCPNDCNCTNDFAHCRGDNATYFNVLEKLPASIETFKFTIFTPTPGQNIAIDINAAGLKRFRNLQTYSIDPALNKELVHYTLHRGIPHNSFCGLDNLEVVHINVRFSHLKASGLDCIRGLTVLDLSYARMITEESIEGLLTANLSCNIRKLLLRSIQTLTYGEIKQFDFFRLLNGEKWNNLEELDLSANGITSVSSGLLLLPNLKKLDLSENWLSSKIGRDYLSKWAMVTTFMHPSLKEVSFANQISPQPARRRRDVASRKTSWFPDLQGCGNKSDIIYGLGSARTKAQLKQQLWCVVMSSENSGAGCLLGLRIPIGRNLRVINASGFAKDNEPYVTDMLQGRYCTNSDNVLQELDLSNNNLGRVLGNPTLNNISLVGLDQLQLLNIQDNDFTLQNMELFHTFPAMRTLLLAGNQIAIHLDDANQLFKTLENLTTLDISRNAISKIPPAEFSNLSRLRVLDISSNELNEFDLLLPSSLKLLNISNNQLVFLNESTIVYLNAYEGLEIDLLDNPFICGCETSGFIKWIQSASVEFSGRAQLRCLQNTEWVSIMQIDHSKMYNNCHPLTTLQTVLITVPTTICFVGVIILSVSLFRRRWRIRHYLYRRRLRMERMELNDDYEYDAYIAYCDDSPALRAWVHGTMLEELEHKRGLKLFIHMRDMLGGGYIIDRIDEAMRRCRKTILVLCPEFLVSRPCLYEAWNAHTSMVTDGRDTVIGVKLHGLPLAGLTGTLASLMEERECLTWTDDPDGQALFWDKLEDAILSPANNPIID